MVASYDRIWFGPLSSMILLNENIWKQNAALEHVMASFNLSKLYDPVHMHC